MNPSLSLLRELYSVHFGTSPDTVTPLSGSASNRQYYRLSATPTGASVIGVIGEDRKENHAFLSLARHMRACGLAVPGILAVSADEMLYLQEDLGTVSLYDLIAAGQKAGAMTPQLQQLLRRVMSDLSRLQFATAEGFDFEHDTARQQRFEAMNIHWDLNYFKYCFLKPCGLPFDEVALESDFERFTRQLLAIAEGQGVRSFLYRDFQSRNVMVVGETPYYIDFQGGFEGPCYYDVASFLWQARAGYSDALRSELLHTYHEGLQAYLPLSYADFEARLMPFVLFRLIQVLGAYGFRGLFERKAMFLSPIRQALDLLLSLPDEVLQPYPALCSLLLPLSQLPQFQPAQDTRLHIRVTSFSYKKGIPDDPSGNGGGFVFDCRAPHNPGRYQEYKRLTGLDQPVIDFLEGRVHDYDREKLGTELTMPEYLTHVYGVVDPAVATYLRRGFTSLMISFGCTGGQHRSVYGAQHTAEHLHALYPDAVIELWHREQGIRYQL